MDVKFYEICHNREYTAYSFLWVQRPDKKDTAVFCKEAIERGSTYKLFKITTNTSNTMIILKENIKLGLQIGKVWKNVAL